MEEVRYYAQELLRLSERRQVVLNNMVALVQPLPEYDILRSIPAILLTFMSNEKDNTFNKSSCSSFNTSSHSDNILPQVPNLYHPC